MTFTSDVDAEVSGRHVCCSMTSVLLALVRAERGDEGVDRLLTEASSGRSASFLENQDNWISVDESISLLAAGVLLTSDPRLPRRVGEHAVRRHAGTQVATLLRSLGSPEAILSSITQAAGKFTTITEMRAVQTGPGLAIVRASARAGFTRHPLLCQYTAGLLSQATVLFGLEPATVQETSCLAAGDDVCCFTVTWDAELAASAADPARRVTELERQLLAASDRLQGIYATAGDLLSPDEIDVVLTRIVERAAGTVRAPQYVLAVHPMPDSEQRIYCDGVDRDEGAAIARAAQSATSEPSESTLIAKVASSRREYGLLIAINPDGSQFFPQERRLLELYARHAAAVLDMAMALEESARRHRAVSALVALSQELAQAGSGRDTAERLAAAVPTVLDCDHVSVCLDDAAIPRRFSTAVEPTFFAAPADEPFIAKLMSNERLCSLVAVPVLAGDQLLGLLTVGVRNNPERLRSSDDLLERLTGVAALAAPAIQNGRLVDELRYQASHDVLTGLANRFGFAEQIGRALADADSGNGHVGLLFVDLDGFKRINDEYGHEAGDELLRQTADRLARSVRSGDTIARLGGDEFAVILTAITSSAEVTAAAEHLRAAFVEEFEVADLPISVTASVGKAIWPDDGGGVEALIRHADTAMYRDKPQHLER